MKKHKIQIIVSWAGDNFCGAWDDGHDGGVLATAASLEELRDNFAESIGLHVKGCVEDGDRFPEYLVNGDYDIEFNLDAAALTRNAKSPSGAERANNERLMTQEDFIEKHKEDPILSKLRFMEREDLLRVLNGAYIAERFFGKSTSWFSQKLNRHLKNGKPCEFTPEELETLSNALRTISLELQDLADELH